MMYSMRTTKKINKTKNYSATLFHLAILTYKKILKSLKILIVVNKKNQEFRTYKMSEKRIYKTNFIGNLNMLISFKFKESIVQLLLIFLKKFRLLTLFTRKLSVGGLLERSF